MAVTLKGPLYADRLAAWYGGLITYAFYAAMGLNVVLGMVILIQHLHRDDKYILEVDHKGEPVGTVIAVRSVQAIPDGILKGQLGDFIHDAFSIDQDGDEENRLWNRTQARLTGAAARTMEAWYERDRNRHNPKIIYRNTWAEANKLDVLKLDDSGHYQADYTVTTHADNDTTQTTANWRLTMHIITGHSNDPESVGWFIDWVDFLEVK